MENLVYAIVLLPLGILIGFFGKNLPKSVCWRIGNFGGFRIFVITTSIFLGFKSDSAPVVVKAFEWFRVNGFRLILDSRSISYH
jgi:NADH-quinone oxidoreductase subunit L